MTKTKADRQTYTHTLRVRLMPEHDALVREAAKAAMLKKGAGDLSSWMRRVLVAAARKELGR